ncbi:MAG: 30S ribosomal protein S20 [Acidobacteria bacterium]|nr:30S ribosomal protein S20 [Acidobacteriota bacterium]NIM60518.1 30S ribosomal protein S20 [Acidobacteriota bacterium]NIO59489.1 30S ribosomal protein S20 [Acidobacteriota bacterium]NIQ30518.1 30S ribosomal protein S20 [Acidobacteriota bacterium]NIQ85466.1 30S ribosomal protein S20 [Acidobacteriota bacterium]
MATHKSAIKQNRQDTKRRLANRRHKTRVRTAVRATRAAIAAGDAEKAAGLMGPTISLLDRASKTSALHDNTVGRTKSRLQRAYNKLASK